MFGVAGFFGTFIDYLRPTKSPYLVVILIAVGVICFKVGVPTRDPTLRLLQLAEQLDIPGFFLPIFAIIFAMVPLSLVRRTKIDTETKQEVKDPIANAKYENDLDGVFKFSRALCLAIAAIMLFVYYNSPPSDNWYSTLGYWIILLQLITFLSYMAFRHYIADDISNIGLFQISFITAVLFAGCTYLATEIHDGESSLHYFYYCKTQNVEFVGIAGTEQYKCNETIPPDRGTIKHVTQFYRPDFRQISFAVVAACWTVYEFFWLNILLQMAGSRKLPASKDPNLLPS